MNTGNFIANYPGLFVLIAAITSNFTAQLTKFVIDRVVTKKWHVETLFTTGGMPSSHTAFVVSALISVGLTAGITSINFAIMFMLTAIVVHDALGIRRHAGKQAKVLNAIVEDFIELTDILQKGNVLESDTYNKKLKEFLGHEPIEVLGGIVFGTILTGIVYLIFMNI